LYFGHLGKTPVLVLSGRAHFYEGHRWSASRSPSAHAGGVWHHGFAADERGGRHQQKFRAGDFMVLTDHINFMGANPLRGAAISGFAAFVDLTELTTKNCASFCSAPEKFPN
jgi:purine-nucleoside phosphorylase